MNIGGGAVGVVDRPITGVTAAPPSLLPSIGRTTTRILDDHEGDNNNEDDRMDDRDEDRRQ